MYRKFASFSRIKIQFLTVIGYSIDKMAIGIATEKAKDFALQQLRLSDIFPINGENYQTIADIRNSDLGKTANNLIPNPIPK